MVDHKDFSTGVNPTSCLPRIKEEPASLNIFQVLAHLSRLYSPHSVTREEQALWTTNSDDVPACDSDDFDSYQDAIESAKVDDHEKRYAMNWLTRLIGSGLYWIDEEDGLLSADSLLDLAGRILGGHASLEEAGAISREFVFPLKEPVLIPEDDAFPHPATLSPDPIELVLRDDPLPPSDKNSEANAHSTGGASQDAAAAVGVQTWGASIVVSDVLVRHPTLFHPALAGAMSHRLKVAELGAGTGLIGMAAAKLLAQKGQEADVVLTDYHQQVLRNLEFNVTQNFNEAESSSVSVTVEHLDWLVMHEKLLFGDANIDDPKQSKYDLLLLADVIYAPEHAQWIRSSIETLLRKPAPDDVGEPTARAHIIMAVRGSGKFEGLFKTVEDAFKPRSTRSGVPLLSCSSTITPLDTMPGTPALVSESLSSLSADTQKSNSMHSDLLRSRMDALSVQETANQQASHSAELGILKRRRLDKRASVGRNDEQEYLWFEIGWCSQ